MANLRSADQEQLQKLLLGRLPSAEIERLAIEYADDSRLAELAESLTDQNDALLQLLHNHETAMVDPEGERLVERLVQRLKPALTVAPKDDTAAMRLAEVSTEPSLSALAKPPQQMPERLEYYRPIKILGQGGMGTVYLAEDTRLGREVAIKTLRPELAINPQAKERFLREARTAAKLEHDNVIPIYSVGEADGTPFLAMPLLKGEPLDALIRRTTAPLSIATVVRMSREIASGLAAAHARGLIHRDIKPANIWLESPTGRVKILDFGLAKAADASGDPDSETHLTASGAIVGTPAYMAPEQASGHSIDTRADLFSLGCVMYELLTGKRAFSGPNTMAILMSLANHTPPAPQQLRAECPAALSQLVMQLLEKAPAKRPDSAEAVIRALNELESKPAAGSIQLNGPALVAGVSSDRSTPRDSSTPVAIIAPLEASDSIDTPPPTTILPVRQPSVPKRRMLVALASVLTLLLAAVIYRIQTDQGTLVVTIEDPSVQAILEQDGLVIRDKNSDRIWTIKATEAKSLPSGEYHLKANQQLLVTDESGVELTTDTFTLKRKGEVRVRVTLDQNAKFAGKDGDANKAIIGPGWHGWPADAPKPAIAPFSADEARQHQEAWAKYRNVPVEYTNSIGMKFRLIPPGEFTMGMTKEEAEAVAAQDPKDERWSLSSATEHRVQLTQAYYVGTYEVTQEQYEKVMGVNPSSFSASGQGKDKVAGEDTKQHPVEFVSFVDAAEFCIKLSKQEQLKPVYFSANGVITLLPGDGYRLPTEAEWEYACRAGTNTAWFHGEQESSLGTVAWFLSNSGGMTHPVGQLKANPFGLYDVHGNVWEWCQDWHDPQAYAQRGTGSAVDPVGPDAGSARVLRGGHWRDHASSCRSAFRYADVTSLRHPDIGFRLSVGVDTVRQALKVTGPAIPNSVATTPSAPARDTEKLPPTFTNSLGMEFVKVPKGTGWLGGGGGKPGEQKVEFTDDFYLGKYEVTQEEWEKVTGLNPSYFSRNGKGKDAVKEISDADLKRFPVESISWDDCQLFIEQLNKQAKETGWVYRLPSEAEWEYACRGGPVDKLDSAFDYYLEKPMNTLFPEKANYGHDNGLRRTCKVASYPPNSLGLHDMHGDVWEWCDGVTINEHSSVCRITRGGCWAAGGNSRWHATDRQLIGTTFRDNGHGLRVARVRVGTKSDKDPDRRAAEYVLSIGGTITIKMNGAERRINAGRDLLDSAFELTEVILNENPKVSDEGFANFKDCKNVTYLSVYRTLVSDAGLAHLKGCKNLTHLDLQETRITDVGLAHFKDCKNLTKINLGSNQVTDAGLAHFKDCRNLTQLRLGVTRVTDAGLADFKDCKQFTLLDLHGIQLSDAGLSHFKDSKNLTYFDLQNTRVTDAGLTHIKDCKDLESIFLAFTPVSDTGLEHLAAYPKLQVVRVTKTKVTEAGVKKLSAALPGCKIEWDGGVIEPNATSRFTNSLGMKFVLIPKGKSWLGGGGGRPGDRLVEFKEDFYLGIYEVTQQEWEQVTGKNPSGFWNVEGVDAEDLKRFPVDNVSWDDAQQFLKRLNDMAKESEWIYRLPTDAEWEYACRGGPIDRADSSFDFYFDKPALQLLPAHANYDGASIKRTNKVGSYAPNRLGLYDMHGNVWELCHDVIEGKGVVTQLMRGGCWVLDSSFCRASNTYGTGAGSKNNTHGLRVARVRVDPDRRAAQWVLAHGGKVQIGPGGDIQSLDKLPDHKFTLGLVSFGGLKFQDESELKCLAQLAHLQHVYLGQAPITGIGLGHLATCPELVTLALDSTSVRDDDLVLIKNLQKLKNLSLNNTRTTDAAISHILKCPRLTHLDLSLTGLTDEGLKMLGEMKELKWLQFSQTKVSAEGVARLSALLPQCEIRWDGGVIEPKATSRFTNSLGMEFARIPKGKSWLGGGFGVPGQTEVEFKEDFYLGVYTVTQAEWEQVMGTNPSHFSRTGGGLEAIKDFTDADVKRFPVESVSWEDTQQFLKRLNEQVKEKDWQYRLPFEAEWEYACRGGPLTDRAASAFLFYTGEPSNDLQPEQANFAHEKNPKRTRKVGSYLPNSLGLYDMHGNVLEWCNDEIRDPKGTLSRMTRGSSFNDYAGRATSRNGFVPTVRYPSIGLRLARVRTSNPSQ